MAARAWTLAAVLAAAVAQAAPAAPVPQGASRWVVRPSLRYDVLCALNPLSLDPFYAPSYPNTVEAFATRLDPAAKAALARIKAVIKDQGKGIISAKLCLYFSVLPDQGMEGLIAACRAPGALEAGLKRTPYWSEAGWREFLAIREDLRLVLEDLVRLGFPDYWRRTILPEAEKACAAASRTLAATPVPDLQEQVLGRPLDPPVVQVHLLGFAHPHGIKVCGSTFLTDLSYPLETVLRNGAHELLHPPFDLDRDPGLRAALATLQDDPYLMDKVRNHNPSFGYNSFWGYVEEDVVQAFEQAIAARCGFAEDPRTRWRAADDGMHVLAAALLVLLEREPRLPRIRDFLMKAFQEGALGPGKVQRLAEACLGRP